VNLRFLRGRATATLADQVFSSGSNFLVMVVVTRLTNPRAFGAFALAYSVWLLILGVHRAVIVNPMMIADPGSRHDADRLERALAAEAVLALTAASVVGLVGALLHVAGLRLLGWALIALAPWLPLLLIQDLWRWVGFMRAQPGKALVNDIAFTVAQIGLLGTLAAGGRIGIGAALAAWGGGAAVGVAVGAWQFGARLRLASGWVCLRRSWPDARWLLADFLTSYGASQGWQYLVAAMLGPAALGLVRAAQNLLGPTNVLLFGGSGYGLPASVEALHDGGWKRLDVVVRRLTIWITFGVSVYALAVAVGHDRLVEFVYGPQYRGIGTLVVLAGLSVTLVGLAFGAGVGLTAARKTRALFIVRVSAAVLSAAFLLAFAGSLGTVAAGWASLVGALAYAILMWTSYLSASRSAKAAGSGSPDHDRQTVEISTRGAEDG
jgi:O-antigen/teichoic acid export membrane protein